MNKRTYDGPPIDVTWTDFQDRPYGGTGETVEVIDSRFDAPADDAVTLPSGFHLGPTGFDIYQSLADDGEATPRELADRLGVAQQTVYNQTDSLSSAGVIEVDEGAGAYGASLLRLTAPYDAQFWFGDGVSSDLLPSKTHPLRIPPMRRRILAYAARNPTRTQTEIADEFETSQGHVSLIFDDHGDPRRNIDTREIQRSKLSLNHTNERLAEVESKIDNLEAERSALLEKREELLDRLSSQGRLRGSTDA